MEERQRLVAFGIATESGLTAFGHFCAQWIGITDSIEYASYLQKALENNASSEEIFFYLVLVALSQHDFAELVQQYGQVAVDDSELFSMGIFSWGKTKLGEVEISRKSDIITLYSLISYFSNKYSHLLYGGYTQYEVQFAIDLLREEARTMGLDGLQIKRFLDAINNALKFFQKINRGRGELHKFIGSQSMTLLESLSVPQIGLWRRFWINRDIKKFTSHDVIVVEDITDQGLVQWRSLTSEKVGNFRSSQTGLTVTSGMKLTAKLLPRLVKSEGSQLYEIQWTPIHMQIV